MLNQNLIDSIQQVNWNTYQAQAIFDSRTSCQLRNSNFYPNLNYMQSLSENVGKFTYIYKWWLVSFTAVTKICRYNDACTSNTIYTLFKNQHYCQVRCQSRKMGSQSALSLFHCYIIRRMTVGGWIIWWFLVLTVVGKCFMEMIGRGRSLCDWGIGGLCEGEFGCWLRLRLR